MVNFIDFFHPLSESFDYNFSLLIPKTELIIKFSLNSIFQYEFSQRKRDEKNRVRLKDKEFRYDGNLRKETWIHPEDGCRVHRTAPLDPSMIARSGDSSDDEELRQMDPSELNKRFVISFLHVQGKLITRIG
jgi:protein SMG6